MFVEENIKKYRRKKARAILLLSKILGRIDTLKEKKKKRRNNRSVFHTS